MGKVWNGKQWVEFASSANSLGATSQRPVQPFQGQLYWDTTIGALFIWAGSSWAQVATGGGGVAQLEDLAVQSFDYHTSTVNVQALPAGCYFEAAALVITTTFDDPSALAWLGTSGAPAQFLNISPLATAAQFETEEVVKINSDDTLILTIQAGSSTRGSGYVLYRVKRA